MEKLTPMKKALIYSLFMLFAININAQINLEHTFHSVDWQTIPFNTDEGICYYYVEFRAGELTFYNPDYSVRKTINLIIPSGHEIMSFTYVSDKLFNTDNLIEFVLVTSAIGNSGVCSMIVYDENNAIIKDFGNRYLLYVKEGKSTSKLIVTSGVYDETSQTSEITEEIYSLPGAYPNGFSESDPAEALIFPNPAITTVNLPYKLHGNQQTVMHIYNLKGELIDQKVISSAFDRIKLNVDNYLPGIYIYEYNGGSKQFIVAE